jgi:hypothetical protein
MLERRSTRWPRTSLPGVSKVQGRALQIKNTHHCPPHPGRIRLIFVGSKDPRYLECRQYPGNRFSPRRIQTYWSAIRQASAILSVLRFGEYVPRLRGQGLRELHRDPEV